jgi:hypothetical protein
MSDQAENRFIHEFFAEENRDLYYELDRDGYAVRNIDIDRANDESASAVARSEWNHARDYGDLYEYMARFGRIAEGKLGEDLEATAADHPYDTISAEVFDQVWTRCRSDLERRWATGGEQAYLTATPPAQRWTPLKEPRTE